MSHQRDIIDMLQKLVNVININIEENESVELYRNKSPSGGHYQIPKQKSSVKKSPPKSKITKRTKSPKKKRTISPSLFSKDPYLYHETYAKAERRETKPKQKRRPSSPRKLYLKKTTKRVDVGIQTSKALIMDDSEFLQQILYYTPNNRFSQASRALKRRYFNIWQKKWSVKISEHYRDIIRQNMLGRRGENSSSSRKSNDSLLKDDSTQNNSPKVERSPKNVEEKHVLVPVKRKPLYSSSESDNPNFDSASSDEEDYVQQPPQTIAEKAPPIVPKLCIPISIIGGEQEINYDNIDKYDSGNDDYTPPNAPRQMRHPISLKDEEFAELASDNEESEEIKPKDSLKESFSSSPFDEMQSSSSKADECIKSEEVVEDEIINQNRSSSNDNNSLLEFIREENKRLEEESQEEKQIISENKSSDFSDLSLGNKEEQIQSNYQENYNQDSNSADHLNEEIIEEEKQPNISDDNTKEDSSVTEAKNNNEEIKTDEENTTPKEPKQEDNYKLSTNSESEDITIDSEIEEIIEEEKSSEQTPQKNDIDFVFSSSSSDSEENPQEILDEKKEIKDDGNIDSDSFDIDSSDFDEKSSAISEPEMKQSQEQKLESESPSFDINSSDLNDDSLDDVQPSSQPTLVVTPAPLVEQEFDGVEKANCIIQQIFSEEIKLVCEQALEMKPIDPCTKDECSNSLSASCDEFENGFSEDDKIQVKNDNEKIEDDNNEFSLEQEKETPMHSERPVDSVPPIILNDNFEEIVEDDSSYVIVEEENSQARDDEIVLSGEAPQYINDNNASLVVDVPYSDNQSSDSSDPFDVDELDLDISDEDLVVKQKVEQQEPQLDKEKKVSNSDDEWDSDIDLSFSD